jgi:hypothetical protein
LTIEKNFTIFLTENVLTDNNSLIFSKFLAKIVEVARGRLRIKKSFGDELTENEKESYGLVLIYDIQGWPS